MNPAQHTDVDLWLVLVLLIIACVLLGVLALQANDGIEVDGFLHRTPTPQTVTVPRPTPTPLPLPYQEREWFLQRRHGVT
jgi:hypothetical protein